MKVKTLTKLVFISFALFALEMDIQAQVTIGSFESPMKGALLDLKQRKNGMSTKGLMLPRVRINVIDKLQMGTEPELVGDERKKHIGLLVYHNSGVTPSICAEIPDGLYVWNGERWMPFSHSGDAYQFSADKYYIDVFSGKDKRGAVLPSL